MVLWKKLDFVNLLLSSNQSPTNLFVPQEKRYKYTPPLTALWFNLQPYCFQRNKQKIMDKLRATYLLHYTDLLYHSANLYNPCHVLSIHERVGETSDQRKPCCICTHYDKEGLAL